MSSGVHLEEVWISVTLSMLMMLLFIYCLFLIAGAWLMLSGMQEAPLGYEDEEGFHMIENREEYTRVASE